MPSIVDKSSVKMVCVDDFALRKRFSYGTVMINLENHRIVDMIPSRDTNDVCNWLKTFHNIEVISRDEPLHTHPLLQILILMSYRLVTVFT